MVNPRRSNRGSRSVKLSRRNSSNRDNAISSLGRRNSSGRKNNVGRRNQQSSALSSPSHDNSGPRS
jgi:hypothetical protein